MGTVQQYTARYEVGEVVDVTIRGAQVTAADTRDVVVQYGTELGVHEMAVAIDSPDVAVRRAVPADGVPADGVPQPGDIWVDQFGAKYFARAGTQSNVVLVPSDARSLSQVHWETLHAGAEGPIRLLWRDPVVDGSPSDLDVPILDSGGYLPCGCLGTASEHSCRDVADESDDMDEDREAPQHFGEMEPRPAPSTPDGGDQS